MKKAFTLAEIMIVLTIIGILTAILLPIAINSAPDENVMKFKKGNNTLGTVIRELVNSDKYYLNGDLGTKADGTVLDGYSDELYRTYFCQSFADVVSAKSVNCSSKSGLGAGILLRENEYTSFGNKNIEAPVSDTFLNSVIKPQLDRSCANQDKIQNGESVVGSDGSNIEASVEKNGVGEEIVTTDGIVYYQTSPQYAFGTMWSNKRLFSPPNAIPVYKNSDGFDIAYKIFCMDVDGLGKGESPFGYGIRADGKIFLGARAEEWLKKSIQKGE